MSGPFVKDLKPRCSRCCPRFGDQTDIVSIQAGRVMKYGGGGGVGGRGGIGARNAVILKGNQEACQSRDFSEVIAS